MAGTEILRVRNCIHISAILYLYLQLMFKSVSLKILGLKLVKLGCTIIYLYRDTIKKLQMNWMKLVTCLSPLLMG